MATPDEYVQALDLLLAADPDTRYGAIAVLLAHAFLEPNAAQEIAAALHMLQHINEERSCAH